MTAGLVEDPIFLKHDAGPMHPERPERLVAVTEAVRSLPFAQELAAIPGRDARRDELELVHGGAYLDRLEESQSRDRTVFDADTQANAATWAAAVRAAGSGLAAVHEALAGTVRRSFVLCRPPGHHAERSRAMGFCFLNNVAVAAAGALASGRAGRVAIVDWDVHHGNGTARTFEARRDVLYMSVHQWPHYPGTGSAEEVGTGDGEGCTVNVPLPAGCGDGDYLRVCDEVLLPVLEAYGPDLILVSAGFDPHERDPLSGMRLTGAGFAAMTRRLVSAADASAAGRIVHFLEGGYDLRGLAEGVGAVLEVIAGREPAAGKEPAAGRGATAAGSGSAAGAGPSVDGVLRSLTSRLRNYWPV